MQNNLQEFNNWLKLKGKANNTRRKYCQQVTSFLNVITTDISQEAINTYFLSLQGKHSNVTINCYRNAVKAYIVWLELPLLAPEKLKEDRKPPDSITAEQFEDEVIPTIEDSFTKPDKVKALFYLLFYSGLRPSEVVRLERKNINLKEGHGTVYRQKTKDYDVFMFPKKVSDMLRIYFSTEDEISNAFNTKERNIGKLFEKIKKDFPSFNWRPYLCRHSIATRLLQEGFSLLHLKKFLGHRSWRTSERYVDLDRKDLIKEYHEKIK